MALCDKTHLHPRITMNVKIATNAVSLLGLLHRFERSRRESLVLDRWRETYLLEASIHDSDLLTGELGLSQKFLYRHRPGGLLPRPRTLEIEKRLFRSRRVRRRCHDLWSCRRLNSRKSTTTRLSPSVLFISDDPRGHTIVGTFLVIMRLIVRLSIRRRRVSLEISRLSQEEARNSLFFGVL